MLIKCMLENIMQLIGCHNTG